MTDEAQRQLRQIRHENFKQASALLFAANAAVAAAIVQWLLREDSAPFVLKILALAAAAAHTVGIFFAARIPLVRVEQNFRDAAAGKIEDPLTAAPLRTLRSCIYSFGVGVSLLGIGLLLRLCTT